MKGRGGGVPIWKMRSRKVLEIGGT